MMRDMADPARDFSLMEWTSLLMVVLTSFSSQMAMPLWVGAVVDSFGLSEQSVGRIGAFEFGAVALVSIVVGLRVQRYPVLPTILTGLLVLIAGNIGSAFVHTEVPLILARTVCGVGKGLMVAVAFALVAGSSRPTRAFAILNGGYSLYSVLFYLLMPFTIRQYGAPGAFIFMAAVAVAGSIFIPWFPKRRQTVVEAAKLSLTAIPTFGLFATAALATMWVGHNAVWTFVERIGVHAGFSSIAIAAVLSVAAFLTVGGPALAHAFDTRFGFGAPMLLAIVLKTAVIFIMVYSSSFTMFALTVPAFLILTFFITPYVMGLLSLADPAGRLAGASSGVIAAGSAVGSGIGGLIVDAAGYVGLAWAVAAFFLLFGCLVAMAVPSSRAASAGPAVV